VNRLNAPGGRPRAPLVFLDTAGQPRARQATDVLLLAAAAVGLAILSLVAVPRTGFEQALITFIRRLPDGLDGLWQLLLGVATVASVVLVVVALLRRRVALARDLVVSAALAFGGALLLGRAVQGSWPIVVWSLRAEARSLAFPSVRLAVASAVMMTALPHLTKPARRVVRWVVGLGAIGAVLLGAASPAGALAALLIALVSASVVRLAFGSSRGRPTLASVQAALAGLGVATRSVGEADRQPSGLFLVTAVGQQGETLIVKVYGRDAHDTQLFTALWRKVWYRDAGSPISLVRIQQAEHEALLTLLARQAGIATSPVIATGATDDQVLLVLGAAGTELADIPERWSDAIARQVWSTSQTLHGAHIAHGQFDDRHLILADGEVGLVDFRGAATSPSAERLQADVAQALVTTVLALGTGTAVKLAVEVLGPDGLAAALPFVQVTALTRHQRHEIRRTDLDLDDVREQAARLAGVSPPDLQQLRRATVGSVLQMALLVVAFATLASTFAGVDYEQLGAQLSDAAWWFVAVGFLLGQLPRLTQAVSALGASPVPVPLGLLSALQMATAYIGLVVPSSAARIAANVRFFQRQGLPTGTALAVGALDSFSGFLVQVMLLAGILFFTPASLDLQLDRGSTSGFGRLVVVVVLAGVVAGLLILVVPPWRRTLLARARALVTDAVAAVRGLRSPRRIGLLFGGNLATELVLPIALGAFARGFGYSVALTDLVLITVSVSLLAGLMPVPGGIGVVESGLTYGLVRVGMPGEAAFAAVIMYRLATFYLPPAYGFFAFRWLQRHNQL